jgi:RNA polymerase sigma-70 factor, ECF subfamily
MSSPPDEPSDDVLVAAALEGNARAFETLVERHAPRVSRVLRLLGVPAADREDVAQDTFLRVFRHLRGYRAGRSFSAWIYRVAVNASHDWRERSRRIAADEVPWFEDDEGRGIPPAVEPDRRDLARRLEKALAQLSERERAVIVLKEFEELETTEVAKALGITTITVRRHLGRARERLRQLLDEKNQGGR